MQDDKDKIMSEYNSLLNRILNKKCPSLESARTMIRMFNFYTDKGKHKWDFKKSITLTQRKRIYGE